MFIGRTHDPVGPRAAGGHVAPIAVLYGRRRVGKTELLQRFCEGRRAVYFLAAQVRENYGNAQRRLS